MQDVLENEQVKLDNMFKFSLMQDIVRVCSSKSTHMRVDLSPRLGGHTVANQPPPRYCPPLIHLHPPAERCKVSQQVWNRVMN